MVRIRQTWRRINKTLSCLAVCGLLAGWLLFLGAAGILGAARAAEPTNAGSDQFTVAASYYKQQQWREAADEFHAFSEQFSGDARRGDALFYEAEALMQLQEFKSAHERFARLLESNPAESMKRRATFRLGETLYLTNERAAAKESLEEFRRQYPDDPMMAYAVPYLAEIAYEEGDVTQARDLYSLGLSDYASGPLADDCRLGLAKSLAAANQREQAAPFFDYLIERRGPLADDALYWKAESLRGAGSDLAAAVYERVNVDWPQSDWADDSLHKRVQLAVEAGDHAAVGQLADEFQTAFADSPLALSVERLRGKSLLKQADYASAEKVFERVASAATDADAIAAAGDAYYLAVASLGQEKYDEARRAVDAVALDGLPPNVAAQLLSARGAALAGLQDFSAAAADLERSLTLHPQSSDAERRRAQLVVALTSAGELDRAEQVLVELKDRDLLADAARHFAETAFAKGETARAEKWFATLAPPPGVVAEQNVRESGDPSDDAAALSGLAWSQWRSGQHQAASVSFGRIADEHPRHDLAAEAALMRAKSLEKLGQGAEALEAYQAVIESYPQAEERAEAMLSGALLVAAGADLSEAPPDGDIEHKQRAVSLLGQVVEQFPEFKRLDAALYERAWLLDELGQAAESTDAFARLNAEHPGSEYWADATYRLAERAARAKDYEAAKAALMQLATADQEEEIKAHVWFLEAQIAAAEERWGDVSSPLAQLLETSPDHSLALSAEYWIAEAMFQTEAYDQAAERLEAIAGKMEGRSDAWAPMIPLRRAQILAREGKWAEAFELAQSIEQQYPEFRQQYEVDYLLGRCLGKRGEFDAARKAYERVTGSPEFGRTETAAMAQWMIGESFFHQRRYDEAINAYNRVVILFKWPNWQAGALLQAGKCYELKGKRGEAQKRYEQLLKDYPETPFSAEASSRLSKETKSNAGSNRAATAGQQARARQ